MKKYFLILLLPLCIGATVIRIPFPGGAQVPAVIDSYSEANQDNYSVMHSTNKHGNAQCLTLASGKAITSVKAYLRLDGSPTGNAVVKIYAVTGTVGTDAYPTGAALATSGTLDVTTLTTSFVLYEFTFASPYSAGAGDYAIALEYSGGSAGNAVWYGLDASSPAHGGNLAQQDASDVWSAAGSFDGIFYLYGY